MADKFEREIEEILAKLDEQEVAKRATGHAPISILAHRGKAKPKPNLTAKPARRSPLGEALNPATLLLVGAGLVVGGLLFSNAWHPLVWVSLAGVLLFLAAFAWSFVRSPSTPRAPRGGVYWRDRYISYEPTNESPWRRVKRRFRR